MELEEYRRRVLAGVPVLLHSETEISNLTRESWLAGRPPGDVTAELVAYTTSVGARFTESVRPD